MKPTGTVNRVKFPGFNLALTSQLYFNIKLCWLYQNYGNEGMSSLGDNFLFSSILFSSITDFISAINLVVSVQY